MNGLGTIIAAGYDDTPGAWSFSADSANGGGEFTFSSQTAAVASVPDGGATVALFGLSLIGLQAARRLVKKKA